MLHVSKWEMKVGADRNTFGEVALNMCNSAKKVNGVNSAKYYWLNPNVIGFAIDAETGKWGAGAEPNGETMKAFFDLANIPSNIMDETWIDAGLGQKRSDLA